MAVPPFDYRHLSIDKRLQLVEDIWDSIAEEANVRAEALPLSAAQVAELQRRVADADAHPDEESRESKFGSAMADQHSINRTLVSS